MPKQKDTLGDLHLHLLLHTNGFSVTYARKPIQSPSMSGLYFNYHKYLLLIIFLVICFFIKIVMLINHHCNRQFSETKSLSSYKVYFYLITHNYTKETLYYKLETTSFFTLCFNINNVLGSIHHYNGFCHNMIN